MPGYFPPNFGYGTGHRSDEEETTPNAPPPVRSSGASIFSAGCTADTHQWADTGTRWSYCKKCDAEGIFDSETGKFKRK